MIRNNAIRYKNVKNTSRIEQKRNIPNVSCNYFSLSYLIKRTISSVLKSVVRNKAKLLSFKGLFMQNNVCFMVDNWYYLDING